jgi:uracil-DNA glycosylase
MASKTDKRCNGCPLFSLGTGFARTDGNGDLDILVVAEALGEDEAKIGKPLVGKAGTTWNRIVTRTFDDTLKRNLKRDDFVHANIVNCRPPDNVLVGASYEQGAIDHCRPYLEETIKDVRPKAILTLGDSALRWFTGHKGITKLRGYVFDTPYGPVVPTYHPSYIQRGNFHLARVVQTDILKALKVSREGLGAFYHAKSYIPHPSPLDANSFLTRWLRAGRPPLAFDIETPYGSDKKDEEMNIEDDESYTVLMCSFAYSPYEAISLPWTPPYIDVAKTLLRSASQTLVWNAKFDVPRLVANDVEFGGEIVDVMLAWHWLEPALPMGLKYVATFLCPDMSAWALEKESMGMPWYNCADSDVLLRSFNEIKERLLKQDRWKVFERHFLEYGKVLHKMTRRGILVNNEARKEGLEYFEGRYAQVESDIQPLVPLEVKPVHPKKGYKKTEEELKKGLRAPWLEGGMRTITVSVTKEEYDKHIEREAKRAERERKRAEKAARVPKPPRKRKPKQLLLLQGDSSDVSTVQRGGTR